MPATSEGRVATLAVPETAEAEMNQGSRTTCTWRCKCLECLGWATFNAGIAAMPRRHFRKQFLWNQPAGALNGIGQMIVREVNTTKLKPAA